LGRNFTFRNFAKQAIRIVAHAFASSFDEYWVF
jgi:hypothetical protein